MMLTARESARVLWFPGQAFVRMTYTARSDTRTAHGTAKASRGSQTGSRADLLRVASGGIPPNSRGFRKMGGYGSTRWSWHSKANTVEDCRVLDTGTLARKRQVRPGESFHPGGIRWTNAITGEEAASIGYFVDTILTGRLTLFYTCRGSQVSYSLPLESSPCRFGGVRWFVRCSCGRRVVKLYLPPGGSRFACRTCGRLTYESAQEHDARVGHLRRNPELMWSLIHAKHDPAKFAPKSLLLALNAAAADICLRRKRRTSKRSRHG